jgi:HlyD family secretion protein
MKRLLIILILMWGGGALSWWYYNGAGARRATFRTELVRRGDLLATIDATGTLESTSARLWWPASMPPACS